MRESVIVSAVRTPTGKFLGALKELHRARSSARWSSREAVRRAGIDPGDRRRMHHGQRRRRAGSGQNPARQAALRGGLPDHVAALTINKVCGSGLKAVMLAEQGIARRRHRHRRRRRHGVDEQLPVPAAARARGPAHGQRRGRRLDDQRRPVVRVRAVPHGQRRRSRRRAVPRRRATAQDDYAARSHQKAARATEAGLVRGRDPARLDSAEEGRRRSSSIATSRFAPTRPSKRSAQLKPAFKKDGTVTAGNAPGVNDGASALVVMAADARAGARPDAARAHRRPGDERPARRSSC